LAQSSSYTRGYTSGQIAFWYSKRVFLVRAGI